MTGNAAAYFVDRHLAEGRADKVAFLQGPARLTYGDLHARTARMAGLLARHGLRREDRVAMIVLDTFSFPTIFWGAIRAGVIPVAVNTLLPTELYRTILADARVRAVFVSAPLLGTVAPALEALAEPPLVFVTDAPAGEPLAGDDLTSDHLAFDHELAATAPAPMVDAHPDEPAFWLYSSGSTGQPKGVRHVHGALRATADAYGARVLGIREDDTIFSAAKLFFAYGLGNGMTFPMSVGATTALLPGRPTPDAVLTVMEAVRPTIYCGVPTLFAAMLAGREALPGTDRLRLSISAGEALPAEIGTRWHELTGTDILDGVGSTEMLHIFLSNAPGDVEYGTSGTAVPGYDLRLVDGEGSEVPPDEIGELLVAGDSGAEGYWNRRAKSRATFEGIWTRTGDKYTCRADGRYIYCGRTDDMFKVSGQWVSPFEVEQALISHADVLEAAVVPALDPEGLEKPKAFVIPNAGKAIDVPALQDHVKTSVGPWKYPRWIEVVEALPKTATGKIQRFKLRG